MGSELLIFNVLDSDRIQHQPHSAATWTLPHIMPLSPRTHHTRACGHQLKSPPCRVRGPLQSSSGPLPLTWHSKSPSPGNSPSTPIQISLLMAYKPAVTISLFFQVRLDIPVSLPHPHCTSVRVISVVGVDLETGIDVQRLR